MQGTPRTRAQSKEEGVSPTVNLSYGKGKTDVRLEPTSASPVNESPLPPKPKPIKSAAPRVSFNRPLETEPDRAKKAAPKSAAKSQKQMRKPSLPEGKKLSRPSVDSSSVNPTPAQAKPKPKPKPKPRKPPRAELVKEIVDSRKRPREPTPPDDSDFEHSANGKTKTITMHKMSTEETMQLNPVDVVSSEISDIIKEHMSQIEDSSIRRTFSFFREEIATRFLEQSDLVDEHVLLDSSLRKARQNKKNLRTELVDVQQQRDKARIALEKAEKDYEEAEKGRRRLNDINQFLINLEVLRNDSQGEETATDNVLASIAQVAPRVENGGTFAQLRRFNQLLEHMDSRISQL